MAIFDSEHKTADLGPVGEREEPSLADSYPDFFTTIERRGECSAALSNGAEVGPFGHPMALCHALELMWPHYVGVHVEELVEDGRRVAMITKYKRADLVTVEEREESQQAWQRIREAGYERRYKRPWAERFNGRRKDK